MINETILVRQYLNGENINPNCLYRICFLLAKWYKEQGIEDKLQVRTNIFEWANKYGVYLPLYLNACIDNACGDERRLTENITVRVSEEDVTEIKRRFDNKKTRKVALAILCYAKTFANSKGEFRISQVSFADWVHIDPANVGRRHFRELIDYGYMTRIDNGSAKHNFWNKDVKTKMNKYKISVPIRNVGEYILDDNNIDKLYEEIFAN